MPASLLWLDHDSAARDRMTRILALFQERETRDELGIGSIRDALAEALFPGTNTIMTRLRYMLFVPWIYQMMEEGRTSSFDIARKARRLETQIVQSLLLTDDTSGVFGKRAGGELLRLPSSVYWAGLQSWKIFLGADSQEGYHQRLDRIYELRRATRDNTERGRLRGESMDAQELSQSVTWNTNIPRRPRDFPQQVTLVLTRQEADFLHDQILASHPTSLLAKLVSVPPSNADFPWQHERLSSFNAEHRELLRHARMLSNTMYGAALLYNQLLSRQASNGDWEDTFKDQAKQWINEYDLAELSRWTLDWVSPLAIKHRIRVSPATIEFCNRWIQALLKYESKAITRPDIHDLVRRREEYLKGPRSRFTNLRSLDQWKGTSGMRPMSYRWRTVRQFMFDLHQGLAA